MGIDLNGSTQFITVPSGVVNLNVGTFSALIRFDYTPASVSGTNRFLYDSDGARHAFFVGWTGTQGFISIYNDGRQTDYFLDWASGETLHLAVVYNKTGNIQKAYKNGTLLSIRTAGAGTWGSTALGTSLHIGQRFNNILRHDGAFAEFGSWEVELTDSEIASLAAGIAPSGVRPESLRGHIPLIRDGVPRFGEFAATLNGSPGVAEHPRVFYLVGSNAVAKNITAPSAVITAAAGAATVSASATFVSESTGTIAAQAGAATVSASGTFVSESTGTITAAAGAAAVAISATFFVSGVTGTISAQAGAATAALSGTYSAPGSFTSVISATAGAASLQALATFVSESTATISLIPDAATVSILSAFTGTRTGTISAVAGTATVSIFVSTTGATTDLAGYRIYRDGVLIGTVGSTVLTFTDTDVEIGVTYTYRIAAFDTNNNQSDLSEAVEATPCFWGRDCAVLPDTFVKSCVTAGSWSKSCVEL